MEFPDELSRMLDAEPFKLRGGCCEPGHDEQAWQVRYPEAEGNAAPVTGEPGTELFLMCGRAEGPIGIADVADLVDARPWPALPAASVISMQRAEVKVLQTGRGLGVPQGQLDPEGEVIARLDTLRRRLAARFGLVAGIAVAHID